MVLKISVLFSESSEREFVTILTNKNANDAHGKLLAEFRKRGFKRCFMCTSPLASSVALFDPKTGEKTISQTVRTRRVKEWFYQAMYFKTTWKSETMGLRLQGQVTSFSSKIFNPEKEIYEDVRELNSSHNQEAQPTEEDDASTSGYSSSSTIAGKVITGRELVDEVLRVVTLRLKPGGAERVMFSSIQAWLKTLKAHATLIPEILPTEELDRELGNIKEAIVGPKGEEIYIRSYHISIPPNAVKTDTNFKFRVSLEIDLLDYPEHLVPISLPLYCSPGDLDFEEKITMRLATWLRKDDLSQNSDPIPVFVYTQRKGEEWECVKSTELTSTGYIDFKCGHFCVNAAFIDKSDVDKVRFLIEHILFRDNQGAYTSCHFLASDPFVDAMLRHLEKNSTVVHPPTYSSLARPGDEIPISLTMKNTDNYRFESEDSCVLKISEEFYIMKRRESFSFLTTPKPPSDTTFEFVYAIGEKRFLKRDKLNEQIGEVANIVVRDGGVAHIKQDGVGLAIQRRRHGSSNAPNETKIPRLTPGSETALTYRGESSDSLAVNAGQVQERNSSLSPQENQEASGEELDEEKETTVKEH